MLGERWNETISHRFFRGFTPTTTPIEMEA
jgi:hypothetical protein